jgi:hypothetical protein
MALDREISSNQKGIRLGARRKLLCGASVLALLVGLIWPAIYNGQPFFYPDTTSYMRTADSAVYRFMGLTTWWTGQHDGANSSAGQPADAPAGRQSFQGVAQPPQSSQKAVLVGRSVYYGFLLYLGFITSHFWLSALLQAGALLLGIYVALRLLNKPIWPALLYIGFAMCVVSDAPFFTSFLTPDLFAGIAILICAVLLACKRKVALQEAVIAYMLVTASLLFHNSIILIVASLAGFSLVLNTRRGSLKSAGGLGILLLALVSGLAGHAFFSAMVKHATGRGTLRPPFLSARLIADGQGTEYLRATCPANGFVLCQLGPFSNDSDEFLWGTRTQHGIFLTASAETQQQLSDQELRFAFAVLRYDSRGVLGAAMKNAAMQLTRFSLKEFRYPGEFDDAFPPSIVERLYRSAAYRGTIPIEAFTFLNYLVVCVSAAYLIVRGLGALRNREVVDRSTWTAIGWMTAGLLINAIVCGSISEVIPRYQARVVWLLPLAVLLLEVPARVKPWRRPHATGDEPALTAPQSLATHSTPNSIT